LASASERWEKIGIAVRRLASKGRSSFGGGQQTLARL